MLLVPNHQTVRLSQGKHSSPARGACVMELASMLAGEPFSDRPTSVCPVIGAVMRRYNDWIDDARRQDLYAYAAKVVGSNDPAALEQRLDRVVAWQVELVERRWTRRLRPPRRRRRPVGRQPEVLAWDALRAIGRRNDATHAEVLALIDALLAIGSPVAAGPEIADYQRVSAASYSRSRAPV